MKPNQSTSIMSSVVKSLVANLSLGRSSSSVLPFVPRPLRLFLLLLLVLNSRSLPFIWHFRVFRPIIAIRLRWLSLSFSSKRNKELWLENLCPVGVSPFELKETYESWASPDESDYNMHLSNSSYSKVLDMVRTKFALSHWSTVFRDGCWIALGASHLKFAREIPIGAKYEVRMYIGSWDNKWLYVIARFVTKNHKSSATDAKTRKRLQGAKDALQAASSDSSVLPIPHIVTPGSSDVSGSTTPNPTLVASASELSSLWTEAAGETLHCITMNEVCFKRGRLTIPPALILAAAGCGMSPDLWLSVKKLRSGGGKAMRDLLVGGWREAPESERWWDAAMSNFEDERAHRISALRGLREGLDSTKFM